MRASELPYSGGCGVENPSERAVVPPGPVEGENLAAALRRTGLSLHRLDDHPLLLICISVLSSAVGTEQCESRVRRWCCEGPLFGNSDLDWRWDGQDAASVTAAGLLDVLKGTKVLCTSLAATVAQYCEKLR